MLFCHKTNVCPSCFILFVMIYLLWYLCLYHFHNISVILLLYFCKISMIFVLPPGTIHLCLLSKFPVCSVHLIPAPPTTKHQHHDGQGDEEALENGHKLCCYISLYQELHFFIHLFSFPEQEENTNC